MAKRIPYRDYIIQETTCAHKSARDIILSLRQKFPHVGIATIYRHLEQLTLDGTLHKIYEHEWIAYYEHVEMPHMHLIDIDTWSIQDLPIQSELCVAGYTIQNITITVRKQSIHPITPSI